MIAYTKALIVFIRIGFQIPVMSMLFSNLIFTLLLLAETILPWAKSIKTKGKGFTGGGGKASNHAKIALITLKETNLSRSVLYLYFCAADRLEWPLLY